MTSEYESKRPNTNNQNYLYSEDDSKVADSSNIISPFCLLSNYETNCWFNSWTRAIVASNFSKRIHEEVNSNKPISINDQTGTMELAIKAMVDIFAYMH